MKKNCLSHIPFFNVLPPWEKAFLLLRLFMEICFWGLQLKILMILWIQQPQRKGYRKFSEKRLLPGPVFPYGQKPLTI
jgi:hypothetical protein